MKKYLNLLVFVFLFIVVSSSVVVAAVDANGNVVEETTTTEEETTGGEEVVEEDVPVEEEIIPQFWTKDAGIVGAYGGAFKNGTELSDFISQKAWELVRATGDCDEQCSVNFKVNSPKTYNVSRDYVSMKCTVRFDQSDILVRKGTCEISFDVKTEAWLNIIYSYWMLRNSNLGANRMYEMTLRSLKSGV
ncbi:MAG: hypothetical protein ACRCSK_01610 [Fusobacteriaceae bacterium]